MFGFSRLCYKRRAGARQCSVTGTETLSRLPVLYNNTVELNLAWETKTDMKSISRRGLLRSVAAPAAAAVVVGFDPVGGLWMSKANAQTISIPGLDGQLLLDLPSRQAVATDWGKAISHTPKAVLKPGSVNDTSKWCSFASASSFRWPGVGRDTRRTGNPKWRMAWSWTCPLSRRSTRSSLAR